jgi:L-ascorbate metabolism protein UlaG (beta-lactamase superfamily)
VVAKQGWVTFGRRQLISLTVLVAIGYWLFLEWIRASPMSKFPLSDHFDGTKFFNPGAAKPTGLREVFRWMRERKPTKWPQQIDNPKFPPPPTDGHPLGVTFIGHSTVLIHIGGKRIITDPVFSKAAGIFGRIGISRSAAPGIALTDLGHIDLILLSHNHYDHCDLSALREIQRRNHCPVVTGLGNQNFLQYEGLRDIFELDWWQAAPLPTKWNGIKVTFTPAQHFSGRGLLDRDRSLWGGFVVEAERQAIYFMGDSGFCSHFQTIADRWPNLDIALIAIGAYLPRWFMSPVHIDPAEAVQVHKILRPKRSVAIHHGTFALADEGPEDAARDLSSELKRASLADNSFLVLGNGETKIFSS